MTNWLVSKASAASDSNGGTGTAVRSSGSDAIVNATSGTTKVTSITAAWTAGDVGHGICVAGKFRLISAITAGGTIAAVTTATSTTLLSANFTTAMIGQAITGTDIAANTVITAVVAGVSATISIAATGSHSGITLTSYVMATTTGNVAMTAGTAQAWIVGGPWLTPFGSCFATNSPIIAADNVYIGPGRYPGGTVASILPTAAVNIIGDVDGVQTGTAPGEVRFTNYVNPIMVPQSNLIILTNTKFLSFSKLSFVSVSTCITNANLNIQFTDCFLAGTSGIASGTFAKDVAANFLVDRCYIICIGNIQPFDFTLADSATASYDVNFIVRNSVIFSCGATTPTGPFRFSSDGANSFHGGGAYIRNNTIFTATGVCVSTPDAQVFPSGKRCNVNNNRIYALGSGPVFSPSTAAQIVEDYNYLIGSATHGTPTTGVHTNLISSTVNGVPSFSIGQERIWGGLVRPFGTPDEDDPGLYWGAAADSGTDVTPTVDITNQTRNTGERFVATGTATSATSTTLVDTAAHFNRMDTGKMMGKILRITGGTGSGQCKIIKTVTDTTLTVYGSWPTTPDATSTYIIHGGSAAEQFKCTSGSTTTAVDSAASWPVNIWVGWSFTVSAGTRAGDTGTVTSNTATTLTIPALGGALDNTSVLMLYRKTNESTVNVAAGALERRDNANTETSTILDGSTPLTIMGAGDHSFLVPVHAGHPTFITVWSRYDANYAGTLPQLKLDANSVIGVTTQTITQVAAAGVWEQLKLASFTPTANGMVRVRVRANSTAVLGRAFWDTFAVSQL